MDKRLQKIFLFLKNNRQYNNRVHNFDYARALSQYNKPQHKILSLLFQVLETQSQPKLEKVKLFAQKMQANRYKLKTFKGFLLSLGANMNDEPSYELLFRLLEKQPAWGNKTAALFVKAIYRIHHGRQEHLAFYDDVPKLKREDRLYVPVDKVILTIFLKMKIPISNTFWGINNYLSQFYTAKDMEVWDDLWFWGFITQVGGEKRNFAFNEAKYWVLFHTDKNLKVINEVTKKGNRFIELIK